MKEREIKGDFKNERGKMKEEDGEKGEGAENSGDGNNERENLMERQRSKRERGNVDAVQPAVCAPSAALVNTPGCVEHFRFYISVLLLL